jgi:hypothetical protein
VPTAVERAFVAQPTAFAGGRVIVSPFQFTTSGEDNLRITSINSLVGVSLSVRGRRFNDEGLIEPFAYEHIPNSDRTAKTTDHPLGVGALINVTITASGATPLIGQTFVMAKIIRGLTGATLVLGTLLQGYVTSQQELAWPGSPIMSSIDGGGFVRTIVGTAPIPSLQIIETVPTGARWELLRMHALLTTVAGGVNRSAVLSLLTGGVFSAHLNPAASQPPSKLWHYSWGQGLQPVADVTLGILQQAYPPAAVLLAGESFTTTLYNGAVGDAWSAPLYTVREWLEAN